MRGGRFREPLVPANRDREPVEPDGPSDAAQHQMMAGPGEVDTGRQDAVIGAGLTGAAGQELADLRGQPRPRGRVERGLAAGVRRKSAASSS